MASNRKTHEKRIRKIESQLKMGWPCLNPGEAQARWQLVRELAALKGVPVREVIKALRNRSL